MKTLDYCMWCNVRLDPKDIEERRCAECFRPAVNRKDAIRTAQDLARLYGVEPDDGGDWQARLNRQVYKETDCGAWVAVDATVARIGSIVEGSDAEIEADPLRFPFTRQDWDEAIAYVETEAAAAWHETHEPDEPEENTEGTP